MAEIYLKSAENTLILEPRESVKRPFDFGTWTEMRLGFYWSMVTSAGANTNGPTATVTYASATDYLTVGIKDTSAYLPGYTGSLFLGGLSPTDTGTHTWTAPGAYGANSAMAAGGSYDTTWVLGTAASSLTAMRGPADVSLATGYCGFYALRYVIANQGTATQSVNIQCNMTNPIAGADYSITALRSEIQGATYSTARTVAWNTGAAARSIPTCFYLRFPFYTDRIRMSAVALIKVS
jgi:hypothetical protein